MARYKLYLVEFLVIVLINEFGFEFGGGRGLGTSMKLRVDAAPPQACSTQFSDRVTTGLQADYQFNENLSRGLTFPGSFNQATGTYSQYFGNISLTSAQYWCTQSAGLCLGNPTVTNTPVNGFPASTVGSLHQAALAADPFVNGWSFAFWYRKTTFNTKGMMMAMSACGATGISFEPTADESYGTTFVNLCDCGYNYGPGNPFCIYENVVTQIVNPGASDQFEYFFGPNILNTRAFLGMQGNLDLIGSGVPATDQPNSGYTYTQATGQVTNTGLHYYVHTINYETEEFIDYLDGVNIGHSFAGEGITLWDPTQPVDPGIINSNNWQAQTGVSGKYCTTNPSSPNPTYYLCYQRNYGLPLQFTFGSNTASQFWEGEIRYFGVYSDALSSSQIIQNFEAGPPNSPPLALPLALSINQCTGNSTGTFSMNVNDVDQTELGCVRTVTVLITDLPPSDEGILYISTDTQHVIWTAITAVTNTFYPVNALYQFQNNPFNFLSYQAFITYQAYDQVLFSGNGLITITVSAGQAFTPPISLNQTFTAYSNGAYEIIMTQIFGGCPETQQELLSTRQWIIVSIGSSGASLTKVTHFGNLYLYNTTTTLGGKTVIGKPVTTLPYARDNSTGLRGYLDSQPNGQLVYIPSTSTARSGTNLIYQDNFKFRAVFAENPATFLGVVTINYLNNLQAIPSNVTAIENILTEIRMQGNDHTYDSNNILRPNIPLSSVLDTAVVQAISGALTGTFYVVLNPMISTDKIVLNSTHLPFAVPLDLVTGLSQSGRLFYESPLNVSGNSLAFLIFYIANSTGYRSSSMQITISVSPVNLAPWWTTTSIQQITGSGPVNYPILAGYNIGHVYWDLPLLFTFQVVDLDPFILPFTFNISLTPQFLLSNIGTTVTLPGAPVGQPSANLAYFYSGRNGLNSTNIVIPGNSHSQISFYSNGQNANTNLLGRTITVKMGTNTTLGVVQTLQLQTSDNDPFNPLSAYFQISFIPWTGYINPIP